MIGTRLKEIRERTGMNKKEFADYIGVKYTTYNNYETETREPASDFLILISNRFDVSIDYLLGLQVAKDITHSYPLKSSEYNHIEKYRELDSHGKEIVDYILLKEWERVDALKSSPAAADADDEDDLFSGVPDTVEELEGLYPPINPPQNKDIG